MNPEQQPQVPPKPIAYDADGNPLYPSPDAVSQAAGQDYDARWEQTTSHVTNAPETADGHGFDPRMRAQYANEPRVVHRTRQYEPKLQPISNELKQKHAASTERYPDLNLSEQEFVILDIKRHLIGIMIPVVGTVVAILLLVGVLATYPIIAEDPAQGSDLPSVETMTVIIFSLIILIGIFGYIATWVYMRNTFYLTNESIIQEIQHGIFSRHEQTVSLGSIEDASYRQFGILQSLFNYGTIRLSTEGEETTYMFQYVSNPKAQIATVNNAIEAFKNGRPVGED